jgi:hypothetical protein
MEFLMGRYGEKTKPIADLLAGSPTTPVL